MIRSVLYILSSAVVAILLIATVFSFSLVTTSQDNALAKDSLSERSSSERTMNDTDLFQRDPRSQDFKKSKKPTKRVLIQNTESPTIIIGDSRMRMLHDKAYYVYDGTSQGVSFNAISGGTYIYLKKYKKKKNNNYIINKTRRTAVKEWARYNLKRFGKCKVVILSTINECRYADAPKYLAEFAKSMNISEDFYGKKVKTKVYVLSCPSSLFGSSTDYAKENVLQNLDYMYEIPLKTWFVPDYNKKVKELSKDYDYTWVKLKDPDNSDFELDTLHFRGGRKGYNKYMWDKVQSLKF